MYIHWVQWPNFTSIHELWQATWFNKMQSHNCVNLIFNNRHNGIKTSIIFSFSSRRSILKSAPPIKWRCKYFTFVHHCTIFLSRYTVVLSGLPLPNVINWLFTGLPIFGHLQNKCLTISEAHNMNMIKYKYRQHKQLLQQINCQYTHHILNYAGHLINHQYKLKTATVIKYHLVVLRNE